MYAHGYKQNIGLDIFYSYNFLKKILPSLLCIFQLISELDFFFFFFKRALRSNAVSVVWNPTRIPPFGSSSISKVLPHQPGAFINTSVHPIPPQKTNTFCLQELLYVLCMVTTYLKELMSCVGVFCSWL